MKNNSFVKTNLRHAIQNWWIGDMQGSTLWRQVVDLVSFNQAHLLGHEESQPADAVFKQQRFLKGRKGKNVRMYCLCWNQDKQCRCLGLPPPLTEWTLWTRLPGHRHRCRCPSLWPHSGYGWARPGHSGWQSNYTLILKRTQSHRTMSGLWLSVFSPHLVVLFAIQDRITSLWEGWTWGRRVREAA